MKNLEERNFVNWIKIYFYENPSRMHTAYRDNKFKGKKSNFWGSSNLGAQCFEFSVVLAATAIPHFEFTPAFACGHFWVYSDSICLFLAGILL
ncbi:MAG: hypothetical protein WAM14_25930 [Candidatus Nitrosopolaris sp.]